jgi:hypothetical protein
VDVDFERPEEIRRPTKSIDKLPKKDAQNLAQDIQQILWSTADMI